MLTLPLTNPAGPPETPLELNLDANPGLLPLLGAGGGGPFVIPVLANWSRNALETATEAAAPAAFPAAFVARSVNPALLNGVAGVVVVVVPEEEGKRCGREAKYSSRRLKKACFSVGGRLDIILGVQARGR